MQNGDAIANLRVKHSLTQSDLSKILNVSLSIYKLFENNLQPMNLESLNILSNYYHVSLDYLLNLSSNPKADNFQSAIDYKYLQFSLTFWRKRNRISQKELAKEFKISQVTISKYENNPQTTPITYLYIFAKKFNVSLDYICGKSLKKEVL